MKFKLSKYINYGYKMNFTDKNKLYAFMKILYSIKLLSEPLKKLIIRRNHRDLSFNI